MVIGAGQSESASQGKKLKLKLILHSYSDDSLEGGIPSIAGFSLFF